MLYKLPILLAISSMLVLTLNSAAGVDPSRVHAREQDLGWSVSFENDLFAGGARDKDFTYGLNFVRRGDPSKNWLPNPSALHSRIDASFHLHKPRRLQFFGNSLEYGLYGFTPEDIGKSVVNYDDRPYASLVYVNSTHSSLDVETQSASSTTLSLGVLGLNIVGDLQNKLHESLEGKTAMGWANQISDGGEATLRYSLAKQRLLPTRLAGIEGKSIMQVSLGYITESSYSLSFRKGQINSRWWQFNPELTIYGEKSSPEQSKINERYVWGGVALKVRAYNSFLQGQFRNSEHTYEDDELRHLLLEAWAGFTMSFARDYRFSYLLRAHSSEIKEGDGDRNLIWGGVVLSKNLN